MKKTNNLLFFILAIIFIPSCEKLAFERVLDASIDSVHINGTTIIVYGTVTDLGSSPIISHGHCWSKNPEPTINDFSSNLGIIEGTGEFFSKLKNITPGVTHYVRSYLYDGNSYFYGDVISFQISAEDINLSTSIVQKVNTTTIKLSSTTDGVGSVELSNHGHCWSLTDTPTINDNKTAFGPYTSDTIFVSKISNLNLGRYYFRGYLESEGAVVYSNTVVFESPITVSTDLISRNPDNSAIAYGDIKSLGVHPISNYGHCYSTITSKPDLNFLSEHSSLGERDFLGSFESDLTGLISGREYFVRAYATDGIKVYYGEIKNFIAN